MITRWERGRAEIDELIRQGRLTRVIANRELDPAGAFTLAYDAARLALAAVLVNQGLRPRGEGAHAVLLDAAIAQLEPPRQTEIREFDWMRRLRNDTQYPNIDRPSASVDDVDQAVSAAWAIVDRAAQLIEAMPPY